MVGDVPRGLLAVTLAESEVDLRRSTLDLHGDLPVQWQAFALAMLAFCLILISLSF